MFWLKNQPSWTLLNHVFRLSLALSTCNPKLWADWAQRKKLSGFPHHFYGAHSSAASTPTTAGFQQGLKSKANPQYNLQHPWNSRARTCNCPISHVSRKLIDLLKSSWENIFLGHRHHSGSTVQTKSRTEKALACLVFLFCLHKSEINCLVLVIFKFYHKRCISSSNFAFHVCFPFPFFLSFSFYWDFCKMKFKSSW